MAEQLIEPRYLGDGVYASFDGYHVNLAVNHHENHVVALEPEVIDSLNKYFEDVKKAYLKIQLGS